MSDSNKKLIDKVMYCVCCTDQMMENYLEDLDNVKNLSKYKKIIQLMSRAMKHKSNLEFLGDDASNLEEEDDDSVGSKDSMEGATTL